MLSWRSCRSGGRLPLAGEEQTCQGLGLALGGAHRPLWQVWDLLGSGADIARLVRIWLQDVQQTQGIWAELLLGALSLAGQLGMLQLRQAFALGALLRTGGGWQEGGGRGWLLAALLLLLQLQQASTEAVSAMIFQQLFRQLSCLLSHPQLAVAIHKKSHRWKIAHQGASREEPCWVARFCSRRAYHAGRRGAPVEAGSWGGKLCKALKALCSAEVQGSSQFW